MESRGHPPVRHRRAADRDPGVPRDDGHQRGVELGDVPRHARAPRRVARGRRARGPADRDAPAESRHDVTPAGSDAQLGRRVVQRHQPEVARPVDEVSATVVEHEEEPPRQRRQRGVGAEPAVEVAGDRPEVGAPAVPAGRRRHHHVAHQLMAPAGQQPGRLQGGQHLRRQAAVARRQAAHLEVRAAGHVDPPVAVGLGHVEKRQQRRDRQPAPDEAQPDQQTVLGGPRPQGSRASVSAGPGVRH